jgi:hypothetical protein
MKAYEGPSEANHWGSELTTLTMYLVFAEHFQMVGSFWYSDAMGHDFIFGTTSQQGYIMVISISP